jgi:hypothetical protein
MDAPTAAASAKALAKAAAPPLASANGHTT